jgi:NAD dependent epimerase/dehydratase family
MKIKAIITGATGMVGEGVLHGCLNHPDVESVLVINRKSCGVKHDKLKEIIHKDFFNLTPIESQMAGYNACFFCAGVTSIGKKENEYRHLTYDMTMNFAETLVKVNSGQSRTMTFCYVSGMDTDSTENGKRMWARVKGKTENDLMKLPFKNAYMFRPGYIQPIKGLKNTYTVYKFLVPFYSILKTLFPKYTVTLKEVGQAMINVALYSPEKKILECGDIRGAAVAVKE